MEFRTQIPILKSDHAIDYDAKVVSLGSCFAVNMAEKLDYFQFQNTVNPFGILFHPLALEKCIDFALNQKRFTENDIFFHNERWHSVDVHSALSHSNKDIFLENLNEVTQKSKNQIEEATHLIITPGTAWVYRNISSNLIVANCHKLPSNQFSKELLSGIEIKRSLATIIKLVQSANTNCRIIFTISPVRHVKDGFVANQWSKANLIAALQETIVGQTKVDYFPSYEIMMDELRDYRFYESDMIHPSQVAIDYIWAQFSSAYISSDTKRVMDEIDAIRKALSHKPFNPLSEKHKAFLQKVNSKIALLQQTHSHITF